MMIVTILKLSIFFTFVLSNPFKVAKYTFLTSKFLITRKCLLLTFYFVSVNLPLFLILTPERTLAYNTPPPHTRIQNTLIIPQTHAHILFPLCFSFGDVVSLSLSNYSFFQNPSLMLRTTLSPSEF